MVFRRVLAAMLGAALLAVALPACGSSDSGAAHLADCTPVEDERSIARQWNETTLDAIRRDFPAPTVHSRNLFHLSTAMWDAWTAYDDPGRGYFVDETHDVDDREIAAARHEAISFAAYRLLRHRYALSDGAVGTINELNALMRAHCYSIEMISTEGDSPAALGNRIAQATIDATIRDGALEEAGYKAGYRSINEPLPVDDSGTEMVDVNRWQPLEFVTATTQLGEAIPGGAQGYLGPHWGAVEPFALERDGVTLPLDPGPPPLFGEPATDAEFRDAVVEVIAASATLDASDGSTYEITPGNEVAFGDWARVIAEFWADGPDSETPPGHWNTLANEVGDHPDLVRRIGGQGDEVDRLEWDVRLYFVLNGALHDAAIAAWGTKREYDYSRPISQIRYLGGHGQSSDPDGRSYHPDGLPLEANLIEVITSESSAPGERHDHLAEFVGDVAIRSWVGETRTSLFEAGGVDWIRAVDWMPYQRATFVTPAFPGYVSGHSTFSRAAAEVLTAFTGDPSFPGGLGEHTVEEGHLEFEAGPSTDITLQWPTYRDAAHEAGLSRIYGGIHVRADDVPGREMGARCGEAAWELAQDFWRG
ncbi:MAG: vanadium-dependent haloperoxidase [Actinomycetota bacterium]